MLRSPVLRAQAVDGLSDSIGGDHQPTIHHSELRWFRRTAGT